MNDKTVSGQRPGLDRDFEQFVVTESPGLLRSAYLLCGDRGHAEDLVQVALLRALRRWEAIHGSPRAYVSEVLVNLARDRRRDLRRRPPETHLEPFSSGAVPGHELRVIERGAIVSAARRLPRPQQEVLVCRYLLDLSVSETSAALHLPEGTVKSYTARALAGLRGLLDHELVAGLDDTGAAHVQR